MDPPLWNQILVAATSGLSQLDPADPPFWNKILVGCLLVFVFTAFVKEWFPPDMVAMGAFAIVMLTGILGKGDVAAVFGSQAPIVIACMFILSGALERTGTIELLGEWFAKIAGGSPTRIIVVLIVLVAPLSALVNNTPVVVVFMPILLSVCRRYELKASRFLIPLSYIAIVGGTCTIIGTSTNVLASEIAADYAAKHDVASLEAFGMFEITKLGIVFVGVTAIYLLTLGRKLLPDRITLSTLFESEEGREFLTQAVISSDSPLVGKLFTETKLAKLRELRIIEVARGAVRLRTALNEIRFEEGDQLLFKTHVSGVMDLDSTAGLDIQPPDELGLHGVHTESAVLMEGIIGPGSRLAGKSLRELNFRQKFGVLILAVHRRGKNLRDRFEEVELAFGDTLLVQGPPEAMRQLFAEKDFVNLSKPKQRPFRRRKAPVAIGALILFVVLGALTDLPLAGLALAAALLTLFSGCLDTEDAYEAVDWHVIFMIFGMIGLGRALQVTGLAEMAAQGAVGALGPFGEVAILAAVYLLAAVLTELVSNNAVATLLTPIAIGVAMQLGADPRPFVVAVMFGSSASFSTPIGYQTNTYVYGAGGYKFADFFRVGAPLAIILWIVASILIPVFWPLHP